MFKLSVKYYVAIVTVLFLFSGLAAMQSTTSTAGKTSPVSAPAVTNAVLTLPITILNNQSFPTPSPFQEKIVFNSSVYALYEAPGLSNIYFTTPTGIVVPSWIQSGNSNNAHSTTYWLRLNSSIVAGSSTVVEMNFMPLSYNMFNKYHTGEAPQLSSTYGQYDDGAAVFNLYDNFAGTTLSSQWISAGTISVDNGISMSSSSSITSKMSYSYPTAVEAYGNIGTPTSFGETSYFLGGVGFSNNGINGLPVATMGWAQNSTNWLGLSVWNGAVHTYSASGSYSPYVNNTYGIASVSGGLTYGMIDGSFVAKSTIVGIGGVRNATLGFQDDDYSPNHFSWILVRNLTASGQNLPYGFNKVYTVNISETGLPFGDTWGISITNGGTYQATTGVGSGNLTFLEQNGTYSYSVPAVGSFYTNSGYNAYQPNGNFTVNGTAVSFNIKFTASPIDYGQFLNLPTGEIYNMLFNPSNGYLYTPLVSTPFMSISDMQNNSLITPELNLGSTGNSSAYDPVNNFVYAPETGGIAIINGTSLFDSIYLGGTATGVAYDPVTNYIYASSMAGKVFEISPSNGTIMNAASVGTGVSDLIYNPGDQNLYASNFGGDNVTIINPSTNKIVKVVDVGSEPVSMVYDPANKNVYVANYNSNNVSVISTATQSILSVSYAVGSGPSSVAYNPLNNFIYVADSGSDSTISIINTTTNEVYPSYLPPGASMTGVAYDPYVGSIVLAVWALGPILVVLDQASYTDSYPVTFSQTGLNSYPWWVNITGPRNIDPQKLSYNEFSDVFLPNGTYSYSIQTVKNYHPVVYSSSFTIDGNGLVIKVTFVSTNYTVTFFDNGLPVGTTWYLNITGGASYESNTSSIMFSSQNGTFDYTLQTSNKIYSPENYSSNFTVSGTAVKHTVNFTKITYNVTVMESGLKSGTSWYLGYGSTTVVPIAGSSITVALSNGSYVLRPSASGYYSSGVYVIVNGGPLKSTVLFKKAYSVTFSESGLKSGTPWYLNITGFASIGPITASSFSLGLPNGTYTFYTSSTDGYSTNTMTFSVNGASKMVSVKFSTVSYTVDFVENGLPAGYTWNIKLSTGASGTVSTQSTSFSLADGSYTFLATSQNGLYHSQGGTVSVSNSPMTINLQFELVTYKTTVAETGLPSGTSWYVTVGSAFSGQLTGSYNKQLSNGTYVVSATSLNANYYANSTTVTVNGNSVAVTVAFHLYPFSLTFNETGLANGTTWTVTINNHTYNSSTSLLVVHLPQGSYNYTVNSPSGYSVASGHGKVKISGASKVLNVKFSSSSQGFPWIYVIIGAVIAVVIVAGLYLYRYRLRGNKGGEQQAKEEDHAEKQKVEEKAANKEDKEE